MEEQEMKYFMRKYFCPKCLSNMKAKYPKMIDCAFRHNNDEHLCLLDIIDNKVEQ